MNKIIIKGARVNNLKNIDLEIPQKKLTCLLGPSGSGKTSLAFHTLYSESKRRFLNSFPTYLKFFSDRPAPVDVDSISPVLPTFGLPQINPTLGSRSTAPDIMNLTELIQNLYGNFSIQKCPEHKVELESYSVEQFVKDKLNIKPEDILYIFTSNENFITYLKDSPFPSRSLKNETAKKINAFDQKDEFWELLRIKGKGLEALNKKIESYLKLKIPLFIFVESTKNTFIEVKLKSNKSCPICEYEGYDKLQLAHFSPYNAIGACSSCSGFGAKLEYDVDRLVNQELSVDEGGVKILEYKRFTGMYEELVYELEKNKISISKPIKHLPPKFWTLLYEGKNEWVGLNDIFLYLESKKYKPSVRIFVRGIQKEVLCPSCHGSRINKLSHFSYLFNKDETNYQDIWSLNVEKLKKYLESNIENLIIKNTSSKRILEKIISLLDSAIGIGLGHLSLDRKVKSVSAGEYQRLLLLKYLSYEGTGALFIFDEPSLGLSLGECEMLLASFRKIISQGNTVLLVEHSEFFHKASDFIVEMGPLSGELGGEILYQGKYRKPNFKKTILKPIKIENTKKEFFEIKGTQLYKKTFQDIQFPSNEIVLVNGNSGTGKSAVLVNTLSQEILKRNDQKLSNISTGEFKSIKIPSTCKDVLIIDSNLNRYSSRSTVGSLTGLFGIVRKHFLSTPFAKSMGLKDGHLSANSELGRCPNCEGKGVTIVEMQFLEDIILKCEDCNGQKLKSLYASLSDGKTTVVEAYTSPINKIIDKVKLTPKFSRIWEYMQILKLDYLSLDRSINSLSGGERQRIYLLSKLQTEIKDTLIIFENISFGLSRLELESMAKLLQDLVANNNSILIIDKNKIFKEISNFELNFN